MMLKDALKNIIIAQKASLKYFNEGIPRDKKITKNSDQAIIISGIRRCGKSTLLRQLMPEKFHYMTFEDPQLSSFEISDFENLQAAFEEISPNTKSYFFDEIQNVNGWERIVRTLLDRNNKVFITGSNASLLSRELGTKLTGRHLRYELYPFSYNEYLRYFSKKASAESLKDYLALGGFPQYLKEKNPSLLKELLNDIINRDIIIRYNIKNTNTLKDLATYLISTSSALASYNNLAKLFKIKSVNTVKAYLGYFEDAYLIFSVPLYSYSIKKQLVNPRKIYCIDTGLIINNGMHFSENSGKILENSIFIELKRLGKEIYYHKDKSECDFLIKEGTKIVQAIQVCYLVDNNNKDREIQGLMEAMKEYKLDKGIIITLDQEDKLIVENKEIRLIPAWKWMMNE